MGLMWGGEGWGGGCGEARGRGKGQGSHGVAYEVSDGQECAISDASSIDPHGPSAIDALKSGRY